MVSRAEKLAALHRLAGLRMDREMKRFAAYRDHMAALQSQADLAERSLAGLFDRDRAFSVAEAQMANNAARQLTLQAQQARAEQDRLRPGFDAARGRAIAEFGRAQVLERIAKTERAARRRGGEG